MFVSHSYNKTLNTDSQKEKLICAFLNSIFLQFVNYFKDGTLPDEEFFKSKFQKREFFKTNITKHILKHIICAFALFNSYPTHTIIHFFLHGSC